MVIHLIYNQSVPLSFNLPPDFFLHICILLGDHSRSIHSFDCRLLFTLTVFILSVFLWYRKELWWWVMLMVVYHIWENKNFFHPFEICIDDDFKRHKIYSFYCYKKLGLSLFSLCYLSRKSGFRWKIVHIYGNFLNVLDNIQTREKAEYNECKIIKS